MGCRLGKQAVVDGLCYVSCLSALSATSKVSHDQSCTLSSHTHVYHIPLSSQRIQPALFVVYEPALII